MLERPGLATNVMQVLNGNDPVPKTQFPHKFQTALLTSAIHILRLCRHFLITPVARVLANLMFLIPKQNTMGCLSEATPEDSPTIIYLFVSTRSLDRNEIRNNLRIISITF